MLKLEGPSRAACASLVFVGCAYLPETVKPLLLSVRFGGLAIKTPSATGLDVNICGGCLWLLSSCELRGLIFFIRNAARFRKHESQ